MKREPFPLTKEGYTKPKAVKIKVKKPWHTKEYLYEEYVIKGRMQADIAKQHGTTASTIGRALIYFNIQARKRGRALRPPREQMEKLYNYHKLSTKQIAKMYSVSQTAVWRWIHHYNITPKPRYRQRKEIS